MPSRHTGYTGPWETYRKVGLGAAVAVLVFLFVTALVPTGFVALGLLVISAYIWKPIGVTDPTLSTYIVQTNPYKVAAFFMALKSQMRVVMNPVVSVGMGPPAPDKDHGLEPGFGPPTRLSSYWALGFAAVMGVIDILAYGLHWPFWGPWKPPAVALYVVSVIGWYVAAQVLMAVRRIQGDGNSIVGIEAKPAVMLNKVKAEIPLRPLLTKSLAIGAGPTALLLLVWAVAKWPWYITAIAAPVILLMTAAISASRMAQKQYVAAWEQRAERREFWMSAFAYLKDRTPILVNEVELPEYDEWLQSIDPDDPDPPMYQPLIKVATFGFPPNVVFSDYLGQVERIRGQLGVEVAAIAPIGHIDDEGQERLGTIGSQGFRIWYMESEPPPLLSPNMNHWVRELLCRAIVIPGLREIRGIGDCIMLTSKMVTRPESECQIIKVDVIPQNAGVSVESFLARLPEIQRVLGVEWVRAGTPARRNSTSNVVSLYLGQLPVPGKTKFINPQSVERRVIDRMDWAYYFNAQGLVGTTGVPKLLSRVKTTDVVDKLVFELPDGLSFESVTNRMSSLKTTSGNEFMEIQMGDDRDDRKMTEAERIRSEAQQSAKFTVIASRHDPLKRVFNFTDYADKLLTGREPGKAKIDWVAGVLADDTLAWDSWTSADNPHLLVAGQSGSGKSVVMSSFILQVAYNNAPSEARFWMVEPKTEMQVYRNLDVVERFIDSWSPDDNFITNAADLMEDAVAEMERRNKAFVSHPKQPKNLGKAREIAARESETNGTPLEQHPLYMPYLFVILEECASLFADAASKEERDEQARLVAATAEIARKARSSGIFLICATQYPTNASLPSVIRNQMRRIGMRCQNTVASQVVIGENGLEAIRTKGVGKIMHRDQYRNFRGFWVQDGDVDYGQPNDIFSTIAKLPGKNGAVSADARVSAPRVVIPDPSASVYNLWDQSATARVIRMAVEEGKRTKDRAVPESVSV